MVSRWSHAENAVVDVDVFDYEWGIGCPACGGDLPDEGVCVCGYDVES